MAAVHECGFELVDHPPCSPDLAPSDNLLFPNMKKKIAGNLQLRTSTLRASIPRESNSLQHQWKKFTDHRGDYDEK